MSACISMSILSGVLSLIFLGWIPGSEPLAQTKSMITPFTGSRVLVGKS